MAFIHGEAPLDFLIANGNVATPRYDYSYAELIGPAKDGQVKSSARFYERIYYRTPGPPTEEQRPTPAQSGVALREPIDQSSASTQTEATLNADLQDTLPVDFPQTRLNWDEILLAYRQQVLERQSPLR